MRWPLAVVTALGALSLLTANGSASRAVAAADTAATAPALQLIDQTFVVPGVDTTAANGFTVVVAGEALGPAPCGSTTDLIRVIAYAPVVTRDQAIEAPANPGPEVSRVSLDLCSLERTPAGSVRLTLPTSIGAPADPTVPTLQLPEEGVIPIGIEVIRANGSIEDLITFVDRLETGTDTTTTVAERMDVALAVGVDGGPTRQPDGTIDVTAVDQAAVGALVQLLQAVPDAPLTIGIRPELVEGMAQSGSNGDVGRIEALREALGPETDLMSVPYTALDPTAAEQSGLGDWFDGQVTHGEDVTFAQLEVRPERRVWLVVDPLGVEGAQTLKTLGYDLVALLPDEQRISLSPSDRQFLIEVGTSSMPATPVDARIAEGLSDPGPDPTLRAFQLAAQVLLTRQEALDAVQGIAPLAEHGMLLSTLDGQLTDPGLIAKFVQLLMTTPQLSFVPASTFADTVEPIMIGTEPYQVALPPVDAPDLDAVRTSIEAATVDIDATASMLPPTDERPAGWRQVLSVTASSGIPDDGRSAYFDAISTDTGAIRAAVAPPTARRFTLGGRHSTITLSVRNDGTTEVTVRLRMSSNKLDIEEPEQLVTIGPGATEQVEVEVDARTNGEFPVEVQLLTPELDVAVSEPVVLTARVNALTGLGQLATGAFVLVLLTWWVHHLRQRRRAAAAAMLP